MAASPIHSTPPSRPPSSPTTMAAPSSSSCEVVDLSAAAIRDDATSKLFFSKHGGGGGGELSWPAAARVPSALTDQKSLVALCEKYGVPRELKPVCAATLGCAACDTPPPSPTQGHQGSSSNALCVYSAALESGLRFPMPVFYQKLLRHYGLAPSQLVPNAWRYMAAFVQRCKDAGVEPLVSAFRYFFCLTAYKQQDRLLGWHYFKLHAGRRLFSGGLQTRFEWKKRFFFLEAPEGMPWKCPVAWGKPRIEGARRVDQTDAAIDKLRLMPCVDLNDFLTLHGPPAGALDLLQLHSTPAPVVKPESAAASAQALAFTSLHQLHATLEAGARTSSAADAASEDDNMAWQTRRKRRCLGSSAASAAVTPPMPRSFSISAVPPPPPPPQGMELSPCETSFDGAWDSSEVSMPPGIWTSDALYVYDAMVAIDAEKARLQDKQQAIDAEAAQQITHLQDQLQQEKVANAKFMDYLVVARAETAQLKEKYASEVANLQEKHHKASIAHAEKVKAEHMAEIAMLQEKHTAEVAKLNQAHDAEVARVKHAAEEEAVAMVQDAKKEIALALFPDLDASLL